MSLVIHSMSDRDRGRRALHLEALALSIAGALCFEGSVQSAGIYSLGVSADAAVRFSWKANAEADLVGYRLYVGTFPGVYAGSIDVGRLTNSQVTGLIRGTRYYFALTAYNLAGMESAFSPELTWQAPLQTSTVTAADIARTDVVSLNSPPAVTSISDQVLGKNETSDPIVFTVSDADTPISELRVTASSSNATILPESGLVIAGFEAERILLIAPNNGRSGSSLVTVSVSDGSATSTCSFLVTVINRDE